MKMEDEATLTAVELMRQVVAASQLYRDYAEDEAADVAMEEAAMAAMAKGVGDAVRSYLGRAGEDTFLAVHMLVFGLARKATVLLMFHLQNKLGRLPSKEEMMAELDSDEWDTLATGERES